MIEPRLNKSEKKRKETDAIYFPTTKLETVASLGSSRERDPFLVIIRVAAGPDLELRLVSFVTVGKIDALVVSADPLDGTVAVNLELLVLGTGVALPDLDFGAVLVYSVNDIETEIRADCDR